MRRILSAFVFTCAAMALCISNVRATTIDFIDISDSSATVNFVLTDGVTLVGTPSVSSELANVLLTAPKGLFSFPAGVNSIDATAVLLEPPGEIEGGSGSISDSVTLTVTPGAPGVNVDGVTITFRSDTTGLAFVPVLGGIPENGTLQIMNGAFSILNPTGTGDRIPYTPPANFTIRIQSDVVPEPATVFLAIPAIALMLLGRAATARNCR